MKNNRPADGKNLSLMRKAVCKERKERDRQHRRARETHATTRAWERTASAAANQATVRDTRGRCALEVAVIRATAGPGEEINTWEKREAIAGETRGAGGPSGLFDLLIQFLERRAGRRL